ncbi:hypothetical protein [Methylobacterium gnaphalii]|uniref:DUF1508 domain-containing protein n=1 Tax=Methylobacterium gnaphalii TaxID=1010610 RepID=A0A512JS20_9HYPH|nr:hypothetical protein [Methylobacterium gnaphalii]GEP12748.1 hypothetical protein MGN01_45930 [Methylobacterium gnaphalii]GJD71389.1 hypothetical protein MMMDOFMJ_4345 [Methylobacterium gnaphalii]GLS50970.1 hypothetical protein GCM10007885_38240 [Methylobacterium gnaphalii]
MFNFRETEPGQWRWSFTFREQTMACGEGFPSELSARKAAESFASGVGLALINLIGHR